jgi:cell division protein FtsN
VLKLRALAHQIEDDGFHEIQLNGKQLVFLFIAATVVSVVIFLCGVLVGRGVRTERAATISGAETPEVAPPNIVPGKDAQRPATASPPGSDPTTVSPPPTEGELSYFDRLEHKGQSAENLKSEKSARAATSPMPDRPAREFAPAPKPEPAKPAPQAAQQPTADATVPEPAGSGFALQITALRERGEAETIARRLSAKGYAAYVLTPTAGSPSVYRVRVGKFKTRREAQVIASKLQKEEQFTPWITR